MSGTRNYVVPQQEQTITKEAKESSCGHTLKTEGLLSANTHGSTCPQKSERRKYDNSLGSRSWDRAQDAVLTLSYLFTISQILGSQRGEGIIIFLSLYFFRITAVRTYWSVLGPLEYNREDTGLGGKKGGMFESPP